MHWDQDRRVVRPAERSKGIGLVQGVLVLAGFGTDSRQLNRE